MKNLLFLLFAVLTLSSCRGIKGNFYLENSGKIERIENAENVVINGNSYLIDGGVEDWLSGEELHVGDSVGVYSNSEEVFLSKSDCFQALSLIRKLSFSYQGAGGIYWRVIGLSLAAGFVLSLILVWLLEKGDDEGIGWWTIVCTVRCMALALFGTSVVSLFAPSVEYDGYKKVDKATAQLVTISGQNYPQGKISGSGIAVKAGKSYYIYSFGDKYYFIDSDSGFRNASQPEVFAEIVNKRVDKTAWIYIGIFGFVLLLLYLRGIDITSDFDKIATRVPTCSDEYFDPHG